MKCDEKCAFISQMKAAHSLYKLYTKSSDRQGKSHEAVKRNWDWVLFWWELKKLKQSAACKLETLVERQALL